MRWTGGGGVGGAGGPRGDGEGTGGARFMASVNPDSLAESPRSGVTFKRLTRNSSSRSAIFRRCAACSRFASVKA